MTRKATRKPEEIAQDTLKNCLPSVTIPVDIHGIVNKLNIQIVFVEDLGSIQGVALGRLTDSPRAIFLPEELNQDEELAARMNFTLAHELGHILMSESFHDMQPSSSEDEEDAEEELANRFAAELLMPISSVKKEWNRLVCELLAVGICDIERCPHSRCNKIRVLARRFGVPLRAMQRRVRDYRQQLHDQPQAKGNQP